MRLSRRNVLGGLGLTVIAGGAAIGSGAFSQVEADRTVEIETAGDDAGLLAFDVDTDYAGLSDGGDGSEISLIFEDINQNATTTFEDALIITNNGNSSINLSIRNVPEAITFDGLSDSISPDESISLDITINLQNNSEPDGAPDITFVADAEETDE